MIKEAIQFIGEFVKTHSIKGELILKSSVELNEDIEKAELIFIEFDGLLVPFFIAKNGVRIFSHKSATFFLDDVQDEIIAKTLVKKKVFARTKDIGEPISIDEGTIEGYTVFSVSGEAIGRVEEVIDIPQNPLLRVLKNKKEYLLPFNDEMIVKISPQKKSITLELPKGILDIS